MKTRIYLSLILLFLLGQNAFAVMERGDYPWDTKLRSFYDQEMTSKFAEIPWLLNLGPTGIRARIYKDKPKHLVVKYVFQDAKSPAKGKVEIEDVIVGANGKKFKTAHRFGRNLSGGGGWDGPMMELAGHLEDSQSKDGVLSLMVWPGGSQTLEKIVKIQLRVVGRFADTFPYNCKRSDMMLEELCDFLVMDYKSGNWKGANSFGGGPHGDAHQLLALMGSGNPKYKRLIKNTMSRYYGKKYAPTEGGFRMWKWGFDSILMGEYYTLTKDRKLVAPMKSLAEAMAWGSHNGNGIYTHRSEINLRITGRKPYASIAAISGLQMVGMSLFQNAGLFYDQPLHQNIHQHYLNSASPSACNIAYAFGNADKLNDRDIGPRHAIIKLANPKKGLSGKGPGYICPTGMQDIGEYELVWPTKADPRWKPTDWIAKEADTNVLTEHKGDGIRRIDRSHPKYEEAPEPKKPYKTTKTGGHLAPVGMGAVAHLIGNSDKPSWKYLGEHCANTCAIGPGNAFDGHAASNLHGFWSVVGAARSNQPKQLRAYFDYMKTFLILSETHNGGLILQPWGRDRPNCNSDVSYGPRILPTATGAILLALGKKRLQITGASSVGRESDPKSQSRLGDKPTGRKARKLSKEKLDLLDKGLLMALAELSSAKQLKAIPMTISKARSKVWLAKIESDSKLTFQAMQGSKQASFGLEDLTRSDHVLLSRLVARYRPDDQQAQATAGIYMEVSGDTVVADEYYKKAGPEMQEKLKALFE